MKKRCQAARHTTRATATTPSAAISWRSEYNWERLVLQLNHESSLFNIQKWPNHQSHNRLLDMFIWGAHYGNWIYILQIYHKSIYLLI